MNEGEKVQLVESVPLREVGADLRTTKIFADTSLEGLPNLDQVDLVTVPAGAVLAEPGDPTSFYWVVVRGEMRAERVEPDGTLTVVGCASDGEGFGEVPFLTGKSKLQY